MNAFENKPVYKRRDYDENRREEKLSNTYYYRGEPKMKKRRYEADEKKADHRK
jgi:hypothetical protein